GMGFVTEIAEASIPLKWMGNTAYTVATLLKMIFLKSQKMTIEIDGKCLERDGIFVEVANSQYTGTTFFIAPEAEIDDGKLDIIILNKISRLRLLKVFTSIFDGTHINYPEIEYIKAKSIKVIEEKPGKLLPDGEILGSTPVEIECLHKDIKFLWK
ncbi:MAG: diacylglycerol kinase (ATP), partial [Enterobacterales bacterium]